MISRTSLRIVLTTVVFCVATTATTDARIRAREVPMTRPGNSEEGVSLYGGLGIQDYEIEDIDYEGLSQLDDGGSFLLGAGVGVSQGTSLYLELAASEHPTIYGDHVFGTGMVGVKFAPNSRNVRQCQPYGKLGLGAMFLFQDRTWFHNGSHHRDDISYTGPAIGMALGIDQFVGDRVALFGEVGLNAGFLDKQFVDYDEYELIDDIDVTSARVQFGMRFRL